jgi:phospholipase/carboxylesterase
MEHTKQLIEAGKPLAQAKRALIMLHGRGASAEDILSLRTHLTVDDFYVVAPQATNCTWYPYSFLASPAQNEPWLSSALRLLSEIVADIEKAGIPSSQIYLLGFSQGACLTLEFATRYAREWGGVVALTGGLIGDKLYTQNYGGNFAGTRILMTNSQNDPHVPLKRSEESKAWLEKMGAEVSLEIFPNRPHTILMEELERVELLFS